MVFPFQFSEMRLHPAHQVTQKFDDGALIFRSNSAGSNSPGWAARAALKACCPYL